MRFEHWISEADVTRAKGTPLTPHMIARAHMMRLEAVEVFAAKFITPLVSGSLLPADRERALFGLYYRLIALVKTAVILDKPVHFQSLTGAARTAIELMLDAELLHRNLFADGVRRFHAFTEAQRLRADQRLRDFLKQRPDLDDDTSQPFTAEDKGEKEDEVVALWGRKKNGDPAIPEHWSEMNMLDRADKLDDDAVTLLVREYYDLRNFNVHSGLAGVAGLEKSGYVGLCYLAFEALGLCLFRVLRILERELKLKTVIQNFDETMTELERISMWAMVDLRLQALGEPSRLQLEK